MINFIKNKRLLISVILLLLLSLCVVIAADPGSADDPLITLSYFKEQIESVKTDIDKKITELDTKISKIKNASSDTSAPAVPASSFSVIHVKDKEILTCEEGTELIIRSGEFTAIASSSGGISDVTEGRDIPDKEKIKNNHHLIVPRNDGRGIEATLGGAVMIKGGYQIVKEAE